MNEIWDEEINYLDDPYKVKYNNDGTKTLYCPKNKRGFEITVHIGGTEIERKQSADAIENFYVHNML